MEHHIFNELLVALRVPKHGDRVSGPLACGVLLAFKAMQQSYRRSTMARLRKILHRFTKHLDGDEHQQRVS